MIDLLPSIPYRTRSLSNGYRANTPPMTLFTFKNSRPVSQRSA